MPFFDALSWRPALHADQRGRILAFIPFLGGFVARRSGSADLALHGGRVPAWLGQRMARLGAMIGEAIGRHYGRDELLRRLVHARAPISA
jgi:hypothetical protein